MTTEPSIALVGCGAISEEFYLPALKRRGRITPHQLWLVDPTPERLAEVAGRFGVPREHCVPAIEDLPQGVFGAFNATPSHLHLKTTLALLERGISVFVEKPLGETGGEAEQMIAAAQGGLMLGVNQYRRLVPSFAAVKQNLDSGAIGSVQRIVWNEGNKFAWPAQSPFYFRRPWTDGQPRGTLLDAGSHIIDLLCWWLGGELEVVDAESDGYGGPEEFVFARLKRGGSIIELTLSMHARMENRYSIQGSNGTINGAVMDFRRIGLAPAGGKVRQIVSGGSIDRGEIADRLVENFIAACVKGDPLLIDAASVAPSLNTIDAIYRAMRSPLPGYYQEWQA